MAVPPAAPVPIVLQAASKPSGVVLITWLICFPDPLVCLPGQLSEASGNEGLCYCLFVCAKSVQECPELLQRDSVRASTNTAVLSVFLTLLLHEGLSGSDS